MSELSDVELKYIDFLSLKKLISIKKKMGVVSFFILSMTLKMKREEVALLAACGSHEAFIVIVECVE